MRMLTYPEISRFIRDAGFVDVKCFGNFTNLAEAEDRAERLILVCKKGLPACAKEDSHEAMALVAKPKEV